MSDFQIRPIQKEDDPAIAALIRNVLLELGVPKKGSAYEDASLDTMFSNYQRERSGFFVIEKQRKLLGGGGIAPLQNYTGNVCELQKMYLLPQARGNGWGNALIKVCLDTARTYGFEQCYLETMSYMEAAQHVYRKYGFSYLDAPMGDTGHYACGVHMIMDL